MERALRIAVDAMGSDNAPDVEVAGAVAASLNSDVHVILVGDEKVLSRKLASFPRRGHISIYHAAQAIGMHESPVSSVRSKRNASISVAMRLMKDGGANAVISAGNTGAVMVSARTVLGPIRGVARSAISQTLPTMRGRVVLLDLGANVDCTTRQLCEFAEMGIAYSHYAMGVENPRVGLLNIGEEGQKGGSVAREVHRNLSQAKHMNFVGNIEPRALYEGKADVVVCDGFIGNLFLKTSEAAATFMGKMLRTQFERSWISKLAAILAHRSIMDLKKQVDPNEYPGAPLLGINGTVIVLHGASTPRAVENAIYGAKVAVGNKLNEHIRENIIKLRTHEIELLKREGGEEEEE